MFTTYSEIVKDIKKEKEGRTEKKKRKVLNKYHNIGGTVNGIRKFLYYFLLIFCKFEIILK